MDTSLMRMKLSPLVLGIAVLAVAALVGCQGEAKTGVANNSPVSTKADDSNLTPEQKKDKLDEENFQKLNHQADEVKKHQEGLFKVKPAKEIGFETAKATGPASLGDKVDKSFASIAPTAVLAKFEMNDEGNMTSAAPIVRLKDGKTFAIQYVLPERPMEMGQLISNNGKSKMLRDDKYQDPNIKPITKWDKAAVENWMDHFPLRMFDQFSVGASSWGGFLKALNDPANGYTVSTEEKTLTANKEARKYYRIVAKAKSGPQSEFEIVIDTKRYVPVTVRRTMVKPDGKSLNMFWTGQWAFGGTFSPKNFIVPAAKA